MDNFEVKSIPLFKRRNSIAVLINTSFLSRGPDKEQEAFDRLLGGFKDVPRSTKRFSESLQGPYGKASVYMILYSP